MSTQVFKGNIQKGFSRIEIEGVANFGLPIGFDTGKEIYAKVFIQILKGINHIDFCSKPKLLYPGFVENVEVLMKKRTPTAVVFHGKTHICAVLWRDISVIEIASPKLSLAVELNVKSIAV